MRERLRTYYSYVGDVVEGLQYDFPDLISSIKKAKPEASLSFAAGELAAHYVIMEKFVFYAHHFSIPIKALRLEGKFTDFESFYSSILDDPKALKAELYAYKSYVRELGNQFKEAHKHACVEEQAAKTELYRNFVTGQLSSYYFMRKRLRDDAESFLIPLKEIDMKVPIPMFCFNDVDLLSKDA